MNTKKAPIIFTCSQCGAIQPKWLGRCPQCGSWNTLEEGKTDLPVIKSKPVPLKHVDTQESSRILTGITEFDRVLGGGCVSHSAVLIGGEPGIGKSTLLLQAAAAVHASTTGTQNENTTILYVSGEESAGQIKNRADRLKIDTTGIELLCTMRLEDIIDALNSLTPFFIVIDSIQTVTSTEAGVVPGTINQLKYCANELISWVKKNNSVLFMTAHITKEGMIAGPKSLEHMVDTVITFEQSSSDVRFLRALKNRFGSVDELGIFAMNTTGLTGISDPSLLFITRRNSKTPAGTACTSVFEGTRSFLVEIQALTVPAKASLSRVYSDRIDSSRVARIAAVLEKRTGLRFNDQDLYVNVGGGIRLTESAIDAALCAALYSARTDIPIQEHTVIMGELSLAGEIRPVPHLKQRVKTARDLCYTTIYAPEQENGATPVTEVPQLIKKLFGK